MNDSDTTRLKTHNLPVAVPSVRDSVTDTGSLVLPPPLSTVNVTEALPRLSDTAYCAWVKPIVTGSGEGEGNVCHYYDA